MNLLNAFGLLNMINEGAKDYQEENRKYILAHLERVERFADWLFYNCPELFEDIDKEVFWDLIKEHDESKFSEEEFEPYAQKWFNNSGKTPEYEEAWKHHWMNNEHHPEYWLGEDMPYIYILEMICDWGSFSIDKKDFSELSDFYYNKAKEDPEKNLSDATKKIIEEILSQIDRVLEKEEKNLTEDYEPGNSEIFKTDFLYHATYQPYWEEIQKDGFINGGKHCNWQDLSKSNLIYLARDPEVAISYCETSDSAPEEFLDQIVVLQIDVNKLNIDSLNIDENIVYSYDGPTDPDYPETWQEFQYEEKIPVSFITDVKASTDYDY